MPRHLPARQPAELIVLDRPAPGRSRRWKRPAAAVCVAGLQGASLSGAHVVGVRPSFSDPPWYTNELSARGGGSVVAAPQPWASDRPVDTKLVARRRGCRYSLPVRCPLAGMLRHRPD
jgi:hypothetical protein